MCVCVCTCICVPVCEIDTVFMVIRQKIFCFPPEKTVIRNIHATAYVLTEPLCSWDFYKLFQVLLIGWYDLTMVWLVLFTSCYDGGSIYMAGDAGWCDGLIIMVWMVLFRPCYNWRQYMYGDANKVGLETLQWHWGKYNFIVNKFYKLKKWIIFISLSLPPAPPCDRQQSK